MRFAPLAPQRAPVLRGAPSAPIAQAPFVHSLDAPRDLSGIFAVVRSTVRRVLDRERPGLGLALSNLPPQLGGYWQVTGNLIVLNESLLATMRSQARDPREFNSFVFVILAHEYLHTLGYLEEHEVRPVTARVAREAFGADHPATIMAQGDLWQLYPNLRFSPPGDGRRFRVLRDFDLESTATYIR
ncbi:MAG: hypothetical protein ACYDFT_08855 [Thermoplasmata archaeon]